MLLPTPVVIHYLKRLMLTQKLQKARLVKHLRLLDQSSCQAPLHLVQKLLQQRRLKLML